MTPKQRVFLDRRIAEEHMTELPEHGAPPPGLEGHEDAAALLVWTMNSDGIADRKWMLADEVNWFGVVAVRMENRGGIEIDPLSYGEEPDFFDGEE